MRRPDLAMIERGEADIVYFIPGDLVPRVMKKYKIMLAPVVSGNWWLKFPGFQDPKNPFHDKRVREAISLAINRDAMNQAECAGLGRVDGNWINDDVEYALDWPKWPRDLTKAKKLMAEAGHPNGFTLRLADPCAALLFARRAHHGRNCRARWASAARCRAWNAASTTRGVRGGDEGLAGRQHHLRGCPHRRQFGPIGTESLFKCGGRLVNDTVCVTDLDAKFDRYTNSDKPAARKQLAEEIQREILENYYVVPVFRHAFMNAIGPRIAATKWQDVFQTVRRAPATPIPGKKSN